jgi:phenylalanyl-tRNA synthetase beta chain
MKVNYNWLQDYVGEGLPAVSEVEALLTAHAFEIDGVEQVGDASVLDVDVLPNRSSDCLCHRGIARELATILGIKLHYDPLAAAPTLTTTDKIAVTIADPAACPRFTASLITGVEIKESPGWLKARLQSIGQRPINNIVDATNYVMYAIGQPLHAYDADLFPQVDGKWQFGVRFATPGEQVSLLPEGGKGEDRIVDCIGTEQLIVDQSTNTPIALAGVKGGAFAGVHAGTKNIIIEAAHFDPIVTRKTARRLGIVIDASKRFENEPSRELPPFGQYEIIKLIKDIAGGEYEGTVDVYPTPATTTTVAVRIAHVNALLGLTLSATQVTELLLRTGSDVVAVDAETLTCTGPFERTDLNIEADFIEEVGRLHGLSNIQSVPPTTGATIAVNKRQYYGDAIRAVLLEAGFSEVITSSFQKKDQIQLQNALASDKSYVRSQLQKNIATALDHNAPHTDLLGTATVQLFEIGTVFEKTADGVGEHLSLALGVRTKKTGYTPKDDAPLAAAVTLIEQLLGVPMQWQQGQGLVETNLTTTLDQLPTPDAYAPYEKAIQKTFTPISPYPAMVRDIALWVQSDIAVTQVADTLLNAAGKLCVRLDQFDSFEKDGRVSYAYRLVFQSKTKTLTDSEVNTIMDRVNQAASERGWEVR